MSASASESTSTDLSEPSWVGELAQLQALRADLTLVTRLTLDQLKEKMHLAIDHKDLEVVKMLSEVEQLQNLSIEFRRDVLERVGFSGPLWEVLSTALNYRAVVASYPVEWLQTSYGAPTAIFTEILAIAEELPVESRMIDVFSHLLDAKCRVPENAIMLRAAFDRANSAAAATAGAVPQA